MALCALFSGQTAHLMHHDHCAISSLRRSAREAQLQFRRRRHVWLRNPLRRQPAIATFFWRTASLMSRSPAAQRDQQKSATARRCLLSFAARLQLTADAAQAAGKRENQSQNELF
jgi:hypothetical protein